MSKTNSMIKKEAAEIDQALPSDATMVRKADAARLAKLVNEGYAFEKVVTLEEGDEISGIFDGEGGSVEVNQPGKDAQGNPLGKQALRTWRLRAPQGNMVAILLTCAQFESRFSKMDKGTHVTIVKLPKVQTRQGTFANDFHILTKAPQASLPGVT